MPRFLFLLLSFQDYFLFCLHFHYLINPFHCWYALILLFLQLLRYLSSEFLIIQALHLQADSKIFHSFIPIPPSPSAVLHYFVLLHLIHLVFPLFLDYSSKMTLLPLFLMFPLFVPIPLTHQPVIPLVACYHRHLLFLQQPIHSSLRLYLLRLYLLRLIIPLLFSLFLQRSPNLILQHLVYSPPQTISPVYLQQQSILLFLHAELLILLLNPIYPIS